MPEPDPKAGRTYIWTISGFLFLCILAGGGCLVAYIAIPDSQSSTLLPALGFTLVCLPWIFWITTIVYRVTSRAFGFRMVIGSLYTSGGSVAGPGGGGGAGGPAAAAADHNDAQILEVNAKSPPTSPGKNDIIIGQDQKINGGGGGDVDHQNGQSNNKAMKGLNSSASNSSNDMSVSSNESERPLALSMAS